MAALPLPIPVARACQAREDLSRARRRRRLSAGILCKAKWRQRRRRCGAWNAGDLGGVRLEYLARAIHVLQRDRALEDLLMSEGPAWPSCDGRAVAETRASCKVSGAVLSATPRARLLFTY